MKIGLFTDTFLPQTNGVVNAVQNFGSELASRGHEVHVFCPRTPHKQYLGMTIHSFRSLKFRPYPEYGLGLPISRTKVPELDIVHTHGPFSLGWYGLWVARRQNIPRVSTFHTLLSDYVSYVSAYGQKILKKVAWNYCRLHYNYYDQLTTPSATMRSLLIEQKITPKIEVVPNGVDLAFLKPVEKQSARKKIGIDKQKVFLYLGRLGFEKKVNVVIDAAHKFLDDDSLLVIAGKGPAGPELKKQAARLGLGRKIIFAGFVPEETKKYYFSAADAFLTASTSETQCIAALEALACGCPVIGADAMAIPEVVREGKNGFLFKAGNSSQLAQIVREFDFSERLRRNAAKTSEEFSVQKCTDLLEKFYKSAL